MHQHFTRYNFGKCQQSSGPQNVLESVNASGSHHIPFHDLTAAVARTPPTQSQGKQLELQFRVPSHHRMAHQGLEIPALTWGGPEYWWNACWFARSPHWLQGLAAPLWSWQSADLTSVVWSVWRQKDVKETCDSTLVRRTGTYRLWYFYSWRALKT